MEQIFGSRKIDPSDLPANPELWIWMSWTDAFSMPSAQVEATQLAALRTRFQALAGKLRMLGNLAEEQGVSEIRDLNDGALLLFAHSVYKSYPLSFVERGQFGHLTRWLNALTTDDLSQLDVSGVDTLDDWIERLDETTNIRVLHSTGTTGKLSFVPRNESEAPSVIRGWRQNFHGFGEEPNAEDIAGLETVPIIFNGYRRGALGHFRIMNGLVKYFYNGDESMVLTRSPARMSADVISLGSRLSAAALRGEEGKVTLHPKLAARRQQFIKDQEKAQQLGREFLNTIIERYRGQRVMMMGNWVYQYGAAREGLERGVSQVFARDALIHTAGGLKGNKLPENYREVVMEFLGVSKIYESYGMSEMIALLPKCPQRKHHISPWMIPYLLHPKTGEILPRRGTQTGRFGFIDLAPATYWGGFLSGDKITIDWDGTCACGRNGPRIHDTISRYSEEEGGDDKVTCAGAPEAHDRALAFITGEA